MSQAFTTPDIHRTTHSLQHAALLAQDLSRLHGKNGLQNMSCTMYVYDMSNPRTGKTYDVIPSWDRYMDMHPIAIYTNGIKVL